MNRISILDCTLRDGGYVNDWEFGKSTIQGIISNLTDAGIDIIECGFLRDESYREDSSVFSCVTQIAPMIAPKKADSLYVAMIALGEIAPERILPCDGTSIDGIRLTFHKHQWTEAKQMAMQLMDKGYKVFVQPVGTTAYSDEELLRLIADVNALFPYAFYLVDTLGILYRHDLLRLFYLVDHNLDRQIKIGFHSHNNLQLSFANAQELLRLNAKRDVILDASVYGMGRGVGNLATELLAEYINVNIEQQYRISPLLTIADQYLMSIFVEQGWGYALPYFLSAVEKCHPNYAAYLLKKETLSVEDISKILSLLPSEKRDLYNPELIEEFYLSYQSCQIDDAQTIAAITAAIDGRPVLILGPGASLSTSEQQIQHYIEEHGAYTISVNFYHPRLKEDLLFISNRKRLELLKKEITKFHNIIATSNLLHEFPTQTMIVNYSSYLGESRAADNAGTMLIRMLSKAGVTELAIAGLDGFDVDTSSNYYISSYKNVIDRNSAEQKNADISKQLKLALRDISYTLLTPTRYEI